MGEQTHTVNHTDSELYLLGYLPSHGRVYLVDKDVSVFSFALSLAVVEYQTAILRKDFAGADELLPTIPAEQRNRVARFLESQDLRKMALEVSTDPDHKFDLAVSLDDFDTALSIAQTGPEAGSEPRWRTIGDKALGQWNLTLARECFEKANDLSALLLLATSTGNQEVLAHVATQAALKGQTNIAFAAQLQLGDAKACVKVLEQAGRTPEAALFARTYAPSSVGNVVKKWKGELQETKRSKQRAIADSLADPDVDSGVFEEGWEAALKREEEVVAMSLSKRSKAAEEEAPVVVPDTAAPNGITVNGSTAPAVNGSA